MISFILAMDENRAIGLNNQLPWRLPEDLAYFRRTTSEHTVLMGRKTFESIGRPLPKRHNVILTRDPHFRAKGCEVVHSTDEIVNKYGASAEQEELFVIGGAEVYRMLLPYADRLYITEIAHAFEADAFFEPLHAADWTEVSRVKGPKDDKNPYDYEFVLYERNNRSA
ncbi:dihydrofolate reductase [Paenibacillus rigui]|uniref:Dihydrofolate reductase n=1 Tax=Paenibacillus rigui TaxID=554312 RepID=A0A229UJV3_9BACL|nr:dihydrofolate reductase [Paenibacillus rigui]OXM83673.1 dihydrofolate reductase [Paenibacillus rigui]